MSDSVAFAQAVLGQLLAQGVTDLVLAPGSRSAPLALVADAAARAGLLRLHVRVDERGAGFLALGLAKGTGRCVPVVVTSGTAVGNLLPAVMEAHHSGVPLLVLSADRPAALVGVGANQTTEQPGLFGDLVRYRARLSSVDAPKAWPAHSARAVIAAEGVLSSWAGPAHLNLEFGLPLVPETGTVAPPEPGRPVRVGAPGPAEPVELAGTPRSIVLCGDAAPDVGKVARELAESAGLPLLAEPSSNARAGANAMATGRLLLAQPLATGVERVLLFGRPNLSRQVTALLSRPEVEVVVISDGAHYPDPGWRAEVVAGAIAVDPGPPAWLLAWQQADAEQMAAIEALPGVPGMLSGRELARIVVESLESGQVLCLGNSNPIRDADLAPVRPEAGPVFANRGLSGIDGTLATAVGLALGTGRPATLLCGDLSFIHDAGSLVIGPDEPRPSLRVVVADDRGGSIFATLEYGQPRFAGAFERVFATPTGVDPVAVAAAHGVPARRVSSARAVAEALAKPAAGLEVLVVEVDRSHRAEDASGR